MRKFFVFFFVILLSFLYLFTRDAAVEYATVSQVIDGDTIELADGRRIRYIGIDAPEYAACFYTEAKNENSNLVFKQTVRLEKDIVDYDAYGRLLRYVFVGNVFVNDRLVQGGFARTLRIPPNEKYYQQLFTSQQESKNATLGLWRDCQR